MFKLYINGKYVCDTLCPMPDWELQQHTDVQSAYVTDDGEEPKKVSVYDIEKKCFVRCDK